MKWFSYHIFIHDMTEHDSFLTNYLKPLLITEKANLEQFFFIRYWQGGPHIRFRFKSPVPERIIQQLEITFNNFKKNYIPGFSLTKAEYYQNHSFDGKQPSEEELYWHEDGTIIEIPYEAEYARYGGKLAMSHSEKLFQQSSVLALELLELSNENKGLVKLLFGGDFLSMICSLLDEDKAADLKKNYHAFWLGFAKKNLSNQNEKLKKLYRAWKEKTQLLDLPNYQKTKEKFAELLEEIKKLNPDFSQNYLLASHIHMFNNRIGLSPELEHMVPLLLEGKEFRRVSNV